MIEFHAFILNHNVYKCLNCIRIIYNTMLYKKLGHKTVNILLSKVIHIKGQKYINFKYSLFLDSRTWNKNWSLKAKQENLNIECFLWLLTSSFPIVCIMH